LCIFAEGTCTNGSSLLDLKKGAFHSMLPVIPVIVEINTCGPVRPCYDSITASTLAIFLLSSFSVHRLKVRIFPPFCPNQYMLETHRELS
jgi:hypothetical protein